MTSHTINWLDAIHGFRRPSAVTVNQPLSAIVRNYDGDPVLTPLGGHPYADIGYIGLTSALLQLAFPPADKKEAAWRLFNPPTEGQLEAAFEPLRNGLFVSGSDTPMFQVMPDCEWEPEPLPVERLLPDAPTDNAILRGGAFFTKVGLTSSIHASLVVPVLYAGNVLFSQGGGGYLQTPHPPQSAKFYVKGKTFWQTIYANVLPLDSRQLAEAGRWSPLSAFPWLRPDIRTLILKKEAKEAKAESEETEGDEADETAAAETEEMHVPWTKSRVQLSLPSLHPLHSLFAMPRRTLLSAPEEGVCSVSGLSGPVFKTFERWVHGYKYSSAGWWHPMVAQRDFVSYDGGQETSRKSGFFQVRGLLRMDDWLGLAVGVPSQSEEAPKKGKAIQVHEPAALSSFRGMGVEIRRQRRKLPGEQGTMSGNGFQVSVMAQCPYSNVLGVMVERSVPVYDAGSSKSSSDRLSGYVRDALQEVNEVSQILKKYSVVAARCGREQKAGKEKSKAPPHIAAALGESLVSGMEGPVIETLGRVAGAIREDGDGAENELVACRQKIRQQARRAAVAIFDESFPLIGSTVVFVKIAETRVKFVRELYPEAHRSRHDEKAKGKKESRIAAQEETVS